LNNGRTPVDERHPSGRLGLNRCHAGRRPLSFMDSPRSLRVAYPSSPCPRTLHQLSFLLLLPLHMGPQRPSEHLADVAEREIWYISSSPFSITESYFAQGMSSASAPTTSSLMTPLPPAASAPSAHRTSNPPGTTTSPAWSKTSIAPCLSADHPRRIPHTTHDMPCSHPPTPAVTIRYPLLKRQSTVRSPPWYPT